MLSLFHSIQTGSEVRPASYTMGIGVIFPTVKWQGREADHLNLLQTLRMVELYLHSTTRLHGIVLKLSTGITYHELR
jgi:hypothetical protein